MTASIATRYTGPADFREQVQRNGMIAQQLRWAVNQCNINQIPELIRDLLESRAWEKRMESMLYYEHRNLVDFITKPPMDGCGWELGKVEALLKQAGDPETLALWRKAVTPPVGTNQYSEGTDNVSTQPKPGTKRRTKHGNDRAYTLARLKDEAPAIYGRVIAGDLSANAGAIEAGIRKKRTPLEQALDAYHRLSDDERAAFKAEIAS